MKQQNSSKLFCKSKITIGQKNSNNYSKNSVQIVQQKESYKKDSSKIEDILNHPVLKRRLPPLDKSFQEKNGDENRDNEINNSKNLQDEINYNIEKLKKSEIKKEEKKDKEEKEEIKDSLELNKEEFNFKKLENYINKKENLEKNNEFNNVKNDKKEYLIKNDMGAGTPTFTDNIQELKEEVNNKTKLILKLSDEQNDYKEQLNSLLEKLNIYLVENSDFLQKDNAEFEEFGNKEENIYELKYQLEQKIRDFNITKNQNKIFKQQYDILNNKDKNLNSDTIEKKIDKIKSENNELLNQIKILKSQSRLEEKKLKNYGNNGKYLTDINKTINELKTLESKKHEYFKKYSGSYKLIDTCIKEFENLEKFYLNQKQKQNYFNAKIEEEINRLKEDLTPNKEEIIKRVENDTSFIIRKMLHNEKIRENIFKTPIPYKPNDVQKMKLKKKNSIDSFAKLKLNKRNNFSGKSRKINIYAKDTNEKNPQLIKEKNEIEITDINYDEMSDFEYKEMLNKKEYCYDVITKLEKSIKESQKMYQRKIKDVNLRVEENGRKLQTKKNENDLLKIEIDNLSKLLAITEEENKIMNENSNKNSKNTNKNKNTIQTEQTEKELESQKEYISPEYYPSENNNYLNPKTTKEKTLMHTNSNTDVTRNEILNDLKALNSQNLEDPIQDTEFTRKNNANKANNITMKFPDLSNIEENANLNNEEDRNKLIDEIKKKYNINGNDLNDDFSLGEIQEEKDKIKNKLYYEHENALGEKIDERYEPDIHDNDNGENDLKYEYKDDNNENINNENEQGNLSEEQNNEDSLEQINNCDNENGN